MMSTKTKNIVLLAIVSTFILSIASYTTQQQQQQVFAQEEVITEEEEEEEENEPRLTNQSVTVEDQKIILGDITIPIKSNTQLSLEMPDSKITVEPIK